MNELKRNDKHFQRFAMGLLLGMVLLALIIILIIGQGTFGPVDK